MAAIAISGLLLTVPILFCGWYYFSEFHRISPELAGSGLDAGGIQWLVGGALAFALITASAYQVARSPQFKESISTDLSHEIDSTALHESGPVLLLIGIYSLYVMALLIVGNALVASQMAPSYPVWFYISALWTPTSLLALAQAVSGLQLCWIRFRRRSQTTPWVMPGLSRTQFFQTWVALLMLLVIANPTLNAFAFIAWFGPWNLLPFFGF